MRATPVEYPDQRINLTGSGVRHIFASRTKCGAPNLTLSYSNKSRNGCICRFCQVWQAVFLTHTVVGETSFHTPAPLKELAHPFQGLFLRNAPLTPYTAYSCGCNQSV